MTEHIALWVLDVLIIFFAGMCTAIAISKITR